MSDCPKNAYPSRTRAESVITKRLSENRTLYLRCYLCPKCGLWHITHKPDRNEIEEAS